MMKFLIERILSKISRPGLLKVLLQICKIILNEHFLTNALRSSNIPSGFSNT